MVGDVTNSLKMAENLPLTNISSAAGNYCFYLINYCTVQNFLHGPVPHYSTLQLYVYTEEVM